MANRKDLLDDLEFHKAAKTALQEAYLAIAKGGVQSYSIGSRTVTKSDLPKLSDEIAMHKKEIRNLEATLHGKTSRLAVGVVMRDW